MVGTVDLGYRVQAQNTQGPEPVRTSLHDKRSGVQSAWLPRWLCDAFPRSQPALRDCAGKLGTGQMSWRRVESRH